MEPTTIPHLADPAVHADVCRMPTYEELDTEIGAKLDRAHDALETLSWRLDSIGGCPVAGPRRLDRPPAFADLGALWSFVEDLECDLSQLTRLVAKFKAEHLTMLDEYRREQQVAAGVKGFAVAA